MATKYKVSLAKVMKEQDLDAVYLPDDPENLFIQSTEISRPGLAVTGYFEYFDAERVEIFGMGEVSYLDQLDQESRQYHIDKVHPNFLVLYLNNPHTPFSF